jgi:hypothetical protein
VARKINQDLRWGKIRNDYEGGYLSNHDRRDLNFRFKCTGMIFFLFFTSNNFFRNCFFNTRQHV